MIVNDNKEAYIVSSFAPVFLFVNKSMPVFSIMVSIKCQFKYILDMVGLDKVCLRMTNYKKCLCSQDLKN